MTGRLPDGSYDFTGQQRQGGSTVYDYGPRMYNTSLGRPSAWLRTGFLQPDPVVPTPGNPQALNRYEAARPERSRRVLDNPLRYTDPTGMCPAGDDGGCDWDLAGGTPYLSSAVSGAVAYLEAVLRLEEFKSGSLDSVGGLFKEGVGGLP